MRGAKFRVVRKAKSKKRQFEEHLVQQFLHRCPYCSRPISYDAFDLKVGENIIRCSSCKRTYIKVVSNSHEKRS